VLRIGRAIREREVDRDSDSPGSPFYKLEALRDLLPALGIETVEMFLSWVNEENRAVGGLQERRHLFPPHVRSLRGVFVLRLSFCMQDAFR
jgi:hypothetical protein